MTSEGSPSTSCASSDATLGPAFVTTHFAERMRGDTRAPENSPVASSLAATSDTSDGELYTKSERQPSKWRPPPVKVTPSEERRSETYVPLSAPSSAARRRRSVQMW